VVVINAEKVALTGKKEVQNEYMFFSGFVGGESYRKLSLMRERHPEFIVEHAVKGMLPKNRIARKMLTKLRVFAGTAHTHEVNSRSRSPSNFRRPMSTSAPATIFLATGRRKTSTARVRIAEGSGKLTVNGRDFDRYFSHENFSKQAYAPLLTVDSPREN